MLQRCQHHKSFIRTKIRKVVLKNYQGKSETVEVSTKLCSMCNRQLEASAC